MRVLVIEDDCQVVTLLEKAFINRGFVFYSTDLGEEGIDLSRIYDYDIILLDLSLPDIHGYDVLKSLRSKKVRTPVLVLSGSKSVKDKVTALGHGADDYMTKPWDKDEILARTVAIVRRSKGFPDSVIRTGKLCVNLDKRSVTVDNVPIHLTLKEYGILELFSLRKGMTLTKEMFLNHLYGGIDEPEIKIIDVFICKLRKKLQQYLGDVSYIGTTWGKGYFLRNLPPVEVDDSKDEKETTL